MKLTVDQKSYEVQAEAEKPLLWVLREDLGLTQAKFGCGAGLCGACTVYVGEKAVRACTFAWEKVGDQEVRTVAGLKDELAVALKDAWTDLDVAQCGYCQPGMIVGAHSLLSPQNAELPQALARLNHVCRCGTYVRIRAAIEQAYTQVKKGGGTAAENNP